MWNNLERKKGTGKNSLDRLQQEVRGRAVLDCGATRCVAGVKAIDDLQDVEWMGRMIRVSKATPRERTGGQRGGGGGGYRN